MSPPVKLLVGAAIIAGATAYLAWLGASSSWQYYVLVDECVRDHKTFVGQRIRVSGRIAPATLDVSPDRRSCSFVLLGDHARLNVASRGLLPDNLAADMDVVVEGVLRDEVSLNGDKIITRCASKYQSDGNPTGTTASLPKTARRT
ncbi:MAG: cytochrome c maturation protein CcmE [Planctomycetaceae bacterium]